MTIVLDLPASVENALMREAQRLGTTPERLALDDLSRLYSDAEDVLPLTVPETPDPLEALLDQFQAQDVHTQTDPGRDAYRDAPLDDILTAKYGAQSLTLS